MLLVVELHRVSLGSSPTFDLVADGNHDNNFCLRNVFTYTSKCHQLNPEQQEREWLTNVWSLLRQQ